MIDELKPYPSYRDSGVAWLGEVPAHWRVERAKTLFRRVERPVEPGHEVVTCFRDGTVTLRKNRRLSGFTESLKEIGYQGVWRGDLVIHAMDAFAGAVGVSDSDGKCTPVYAVCEPRRDASPAYYAHVIREMARSQWIVALAKGIRERSTDFRFESFASQPVPVPSTAEQAAIILFLGHADRRIRHYIRAKQKLIRLLKEQRQAAVQQAVTGWPEANSSQGTLSGARTWPWREVWSLRQVRTLAVRGKWSIVNGPFGSDLLTTELTAEGVPVVYIRDISSGVYRRVSTACVTDAKAQQLAFCDVQPGDVLIAKVGDPPGTAALYPDGAPPAIVTQDVVRFRPNRDVVLPAYLHLVLNSPYGRDLCRSIMVESTRGRFGLSDFRGLSIALPPLSEQAAILESTRAKLELVESSIRAFQRELPLLLELRTRLIADVVTGKLDVREAAARLPELLDEEAVQEPLDKEMAPLDGDDDDVEALDPELQEA